MKTLRLIVLFACALSLAACSSPTPAPETISTATIAPSPAPTTTSISTEPPTLTVAPTLTPAPTSTPIPPLVALPVTKSSVSQFVNAMKTAGIDISVEQILQQGLETRTITGAGSIQQEIASVWLDPDPSQQGEALEGSYPLLIKTEEGWEQATLKNLAPISGMKFGALLNLNKDFHSITIDNFATGNAYIDWNLVQAKKGVWDFSDPGYNIETAYSNGISIMANLIWAKNIADWAKQDSDLHAVMVDYITQVMTHYKGTVGTWNVYNEAHRIKAEDDVFWRKLGIQGVRDAYSTARVVDPEAKLLYCDFMDLEGYEDVHYPPIIDTVVSQLQQDGTIDGISFQVTGRIKRLDIGKLTAALEFLKKYNLPIHISEFSIIIEGENSPENLKEQARIGANVIRILQQYNVVEVIAFGLEDRLTNNIYKMDNANAGFWLKTESGDYIPKPIVYTMMAVLTEP